MQKILILNFGSQYCDLIGKQIRNLGIYCEIHPFDLSIEKIKNFAPSGIILSGSPASVLEDNPLLPSNSIFTLKIPILGICYGMQYLALRFKGRVNSSSKKEFGHVLVNYSKHPLFAIKNKTNTTDVWMSHGDKVVDLPPKFKTIASSSSCPIAAFANDEDKIYGLQFHPEVTHSLNGIEILDNFLCKIIKCKKQWTIGNKIEKICQDIKSKVVNNKVILGLSGGVDSSVAAMVLQKSIGENLTCVFIDNGLLRLNEKQEVVKLFKEHLNFNLEVIDAQDEFFKALTGISDPEKKRKAIGKTFVDVFESFAKNNTKIKFLAQGTIYSDVIESAKTTTGKTSAVIKSHHNVGGLPERMNLEIIEPLNRLFKDEVKKIGLALGLDKNLLYRHPFPGPGLGVRVVGEIKKEYCQILQKADFIFIDELKKADLYYKVNQAFAVFLPIKSVGVTGDSRRYAYVIALRAIETIDFMTARYAKLDHDFLEKVSNRIINEIEDISRVVYDISGKPPATIEWE